MKSYLEKLEYEKKLINENPNLYEQFKHWCRHKGFLKDFYKYNNPTYISFEGKEWETLVEYSKKIKNRNERTLFLMKNYSQSKQFYPVYEEYFKNRISIKNLLDKLNLSFPLSERFLDLTFDGPFNFEDIFFEDIYNNLNDKNELSILFKNPENNELLYLIPFSKNKTLRYVHSMGFVIYNNDGYCIKKELIND